MPPETLASLLARGKGELDLADIADAALDARLLLMAATSLDHSMIIGEPERQISADAAAVFEALIRRRSLREPVSRIVGHREFYGRDFMLGPATLDPRPDTETLIEAALGFLKEIKTPRILDLGTGTGAIAITLLAELPEATALATDLSRDALRVARENSRQHGVDARLRLVHRSWFGDIRDCFDLIISNPPYIPMSHLDELATEVRDWDPRLALDGGPDGLAAYRRIAEGAGPRLASGGQIAVEIGAGQGREIVQIFEGFGHFLASWHRDLAGHVRCLLFGRDKMGVGNPGAVSYIPTR